MLLKKLDSQPFDKGDNVEKENGCILMKRVKKVILEIASKNLSYLERPGRRKK
jgi:hypothetical protein